MVSCQPRVLIRHERACARSLFSRRARAATAAAAHVQRVSQTSDTALTPAHVVYTVKT